MRILTLAMMTLALVAAAPPTQPLPIVDAENLKPEELKDKLLQLWLADAELHHSWVGNAHPLPMWTANVTMRRRPRVGLAGGLCVVDEVQIRGDETFGSPGPRSFDKADVLIRTLYRVIGRIDRTTTGGAMNSLNECDNVDRHALFFSADSIDAAIDAAERLQRAKSNANSIPLIVDGKACAANAPCRGALTGLDAGTLSEVALGAPCFTAGNKQVDEQCVEYELLVSEKTDPNRLSGDFTRITLRARRPGKGETRDKVESVSIGRAVWAS